MSGVNAMQCKALFVRNKYIRSSPPALPAFGRILPASPKNVDSTFPFLLLFFLRLLLLRTLTISAVDAGKSYVECSAVLPLFRHGQAWRDTGHKALCPVSQSLRENTQRYASTRQRHHISQLARPGGSCLPAGRAPSPYMVPIAASSAEVTSAGVGIVAFCSLLEQ
eukprot:COSAG02_NODE_489_length_21246_cov_49.035702_2_plen_166_part_00